MVSYFSESLVLMYFKLVFNPDLASIRSVVAVNEAGVVPTAAVVLSTPKSAN